MNVIRIKPTKYDDFFLRYRKEINPNSQYDSEGKSVKVKFFIDVKKFKDPKKIRLDWPLIIWINKPGERYSMYK